MKEWKEKYLDTFKIFIRFLKENGFYGLLMNERISSNTFEKYFFDSLINSKAISSWIVATMYCRYNDTEIWRKCDAMWLIYIINNYELLSNKLDIYETKDMLIGELKKIYTVPMILIETKKMIRNFLDEYSVT